MGILQPHGRRRGCLRQAGLNTAERFIVIHSPANARAALAAAASLAGPVTLASASGAGIYAGPGWFKAAIGIASSEYPAVEFTSVLDCGDEAGMILAALRHGVSRVRFNGPDAVAAQLADITGQCGARIERDESQPALALLGRDDNKTNCRAFPAREQHCPASPFP